MRIIEFNKDALMQELIYIIPQGAHTHHRDRQDILGGGVHRMCPRGGSFYGF